MKKLLMIFLIAFVMIGLIFAQETDESEPAMGKFSLLAACAGNGGEILAAVPDSYGVLLIAECQDTLGVSFIAECETFINKIPASAGRNRGYADMKFILTKEDLLTLRGA